ncbi:GAP family protein [Aerococcus urinaeequi]|uniref:GAP family protein n=1 Tax=Aerococcus urinaeequi TaxID=51665 RepID=UPI003B3B309C
MFAVFTTTLIAGLIDGINPFALTQQFILQSKIKSPYHILYFIFPIGLGNFLIGLAFYFGFSDWIFQAFNWVNHHYPYTWHYLAIAASILIVAYLSYSFFKKDQPTAIQGEVQKKSVTQTEETHLSAGTLIMLGIASCLAEISSIAPYLALLSYYATISITNLQATLLLAFYSFVLFVLPMYGLFLMSLFFKSRLTTIYTRIAGWMDFFITRILPVILFLIAVTLFGYGIQIF